MYKHEIKKEPKKRHKAITNPVAGYKIDAIQDKKIPFFKVPSFQGDMLQGEMFINGLDRSFRSAAMVRYLESKTYCDNNSC